MINKYTLKLILINTKFTTPIFIYHLSFITYHHFPRKNITFAQGVLSVIRNAEIIPNEPDPGNAGVGKLVTFLAMCIPRASVPDLR